MNHWSQQTLELVNKQDYLDQLQRIYAHEEGERDVSEKTIQDIKESFTKGDKIHLMNELLGLDKFPYKDSYVAFLRKDRTALERNPETVNRICNRLYTMGIDKVIEGVTQAKEANTRRGNQFRDWLYKQYEAVDIDEFQKSKTGIVLLATNELEAKDFCNRILKAGITKRPDLVAKSGSRYVIGESKFLSATGGNQGRGFDDGVKLASNTSGIASKVFILDGVLWIEKGSEQFKSIDSSSANIFSVLLLKQFLESLA